MKSLLFALVLVVCSMAAPLVAHSQVPQPVPNGCDNNQQRNIPCQVHKILIPGASAGSCATADGSDPGYAPCSSSGSSPLTTKGDLFTFSTTNARLPVGPDGDFLEADSTQTNGIKWAPVSGGGPTFAVPYICQSGNCYDSNYAPATTITCSTIPNVNSGATGQYFCFDSTSTPPTAGNVLYRSNLFNQNGIVSNSNHGYLFLTPWSNQTGYQASLQTTGIATNDGPHALMAVCDAVNHVILLFGSYTAGGTSNVITSAGLWSSNIGGATDCGPYDPTYFVANAPINKIDFNSEDFDSSNSRWRMKYIPGPTPTWNMEYNPDGSGLNTDGNSSGWMTFGSICPTAGLCSFLQTVGQPTKIGYYFEVGSVPGQGSGPTQVYYQGPHQLSVKNYKNENQPFPYFTGTDCRHSDPSNPLSSVSCSFTVPAGLNNAAAVITLLFATNNTTVTLSASVSGVSSTLAIAATPQLPVTGQGYTTQQFVVTGLSSGTATVTINCSGVGCGTGPGGAQMYAELWGNVNPTTPLDGAGVASQPSLQTPIPCPLFTHTNLNSSLIAAPTWNNTASESNATNPPMTVQNSTDIKPIYWSYPSTVGSFVTPFSSTVNVQIPWGNAAPTINTCAVFAVQP